MKILRFMGKTDMPDQSWWKRVFQSWRVRPADSGNSTETVNQILETIVETRNHWEVPAATLSHHWCNSKQSLSSIKHAANFFWKTKRNFSVTPKEQTTCVFEESEKKNVVTFWPSSDRKRHNLFLSCWKTAETEKLLKNFVLPKTWTFIVGFFVLLSAGNHDHQWVN